MKRNKSISLDNDLISKGEKKAKERGFDFSNYIAYLINKDLDGTGTIVYKEAPSPVNKEKDKKVMDAINSIL